MGTLQSLSAAAAHKLSMLPPSFPPSLSVLDSAVEWQSSPPLSASGQWALKGLSQVGGAFYSATMENGQRGVGNIIAKRKKRTRKHSVEICQTI